MSEADIVALFERLAVDAGAAILSLRCNLVDVEIKGDDSPVTKADRAAEAIILAGLSEALPDVPVVAEESVAAGRQPDIRGGRFILVDPLDGTKEFIKGAADFTVNIAIVDKGVPTIGVVYAPAQGRMWSGGPSGASRIDLCAAVDAAMPANTTRTPIACRKSAKTLAIVASKSHRTAETDQFIARHPGAECISVGSSLKFCLIADGRADLYPRFGRTMEWDTAAGDAILRAAGGIVVNPDGTPFTYGKITQPHDCDFANGWFIASGEPRMDLGPSVIDTEE